MLDAMEAQTPEEHLKIMIAAGILDAEGNLTPKYAPGARRLKGAKKPRKPPAEG